MIKVVVTDGAGKLVKVNENGELQTSEGPYDLPKFNELGVIDTAYNFFKPHGKQNFILTGFLVYGDKQVNTNTNATVVIYEANAEDTTDIDKIIVQFEVGQNQSIPFPNIRIITNPGKYINAKTSDDDIHMTIFGHYVNLGGKDVLDLT